MFSAKHRSKTVTRSVLAAMLGFVLVAASRGDDKPGSGTGVPKELVGEWRGPSVIVIGPVAAALGAKEANGYLLLRVTDKGILTFGYRYEVKGGSATNNIVVRKVMVLA